MIYRRRRIVCFALSLGCLWFILARFLSQNSGITDSIYHDSEEEFEPRRGIIKHSKNSISEDESLDVGPLVGRIQEEKNDYDHEKMDLLGKSKQFNVAASLDNSMSDHLQHRGNKLFTKISEQYGANDNAEKRNFSNLPGDRGRPVMVDLKTLSEDDRLLFHDGWKIYSHNEYVNNLISPSRLLRDVRDPLCRTINYSSDGDLPDASVIIAFYNEAWNTLLRTVHSVINRSPASLIKEIILIDDSSTLDHLKSKLDDYVSHLPRLHLVRLTSRHGAMHARQKGASLATGNVLIFLDSHCECTKGWLEPLLSRIAQNPSTVALPLLDVIDDKTFAYQPFNVVQMRVGSFDWSLKFRWKMISVKQEENKFVPIKNPVMWGGIFAISRDFFQHLRGFDGLPSRQNDVILSKSEGDRLALSFKIWLCGGMMEIMPCSHVGHLFDKLNQFDSDSNSLSQVAMMWLDDFKDNYFEMTKSSPPPQHELDMSQHLELRKKLQCHPFQWYIENVFPDLFAPSVALAQRQIQNAVKVKVNNRESHVCVSHNGFKLTASVCNSPHNNTDQFWYLSAAGEIRQGDMCFDYPGDNLYVYQCHGMKGNQEWTYKSDNRIEQIGTRKCLTLKFHILSLFMDECNTSDKHQIFHWTRRKNAIINQPKQIELSIRQELAL